MRVVVIFLAALFFMGCKKEAEWLDVKTDKSMVVPSSLNELKSLMNNEDMLNVRDVFMGFAAGEPYYVTDALWQSIPSATHRNSYVWNGSLDFYDGVTPTDWSASYAQIFYCNVVLDGLKKIHPVSNEKVLYNEIMGTALFFRSYSFFKLMSIFSMPYSPDIAKVTPGIVLPLVADVTQSNSRASMEQCYSQILTDIEMAATLLPQSLPYTSSPTAVSANALLARIYLAIGDYKKAFEAADKVLAVKKDLMDYNALLENSAYPIPLSNIEDIFHARLAASTIVLGANMIVDSLLYRSYSTNDLRKGIFFNTSSGVPVFKGSYEGAHFFYTGVATDEVYLIRAECNARLGRVSQAMDDLNVLLVKRWRTGFFQPVSAGSSAEALNKILLERRKELIFRGVTWSDLRRLNQDILTERQLERKIAGVTYTLQPRDKRYAFLIPDIEIRMNQLEQNPR